MTGMANASAQSQMINSDQQQAQTVQTQMQADNMKQQMSRWKIMQDTQTMIFKTMQDVTINKSKAGDAMFKQWDGYIRS